MTARLMLKPHFQLKQ